LLAPEPRSLLALAPRTRPAGTQTEPQLEAATSAGVILPETGQFLLLCSLQLRQQLQRCRQTRARVQVFKTHFTSVLRKRFAVNDTFLMEISDRLEGSARVKKRTAELHTVEHIPQPSIPQSYC